MKIKSVKTTITETIGNAMIYDEVRKEVTNDMPFRLPQSFKTADGMEKIVREYFKRLGMSLIKINNCERVKVTYEVPIDVFMEHAVECERVGGLSPLD